MNTADLDHLTCVASCPENYYIDNLTSNVSMCVKSCTNLEPSAYIYKNASNANKK